MNQVNIFTEGIISDLDTQYVKSTQWVFPTHNLRVYNKDGKGFIATDIKGNDFDISNDIGIEISEGFIPISGQSFNNILYIISVNDGGETEIGCYPSSSGLTVLSTGTATHNGEEGFVNEYKALANFYVDGVRKRLRTSLFPYDSSNNLQLQIKKSFDGSIDLYLVDGENPNIVINSGFDDDTGLLSERYIAEGMFGGAIRLIPSSDYIPSLLLNDVVTGGNLKPGNYFIFIKYLTESFNGTTFKNSIGPISIFNRTGYTSVEGLHENDFTTGNQNYCSKSILLDIGNLDTDFSYFQLGVIRFSAFTDDGFSEYETFAINKEYIIPDSGEAQITITGNEGETVLIYDSLIESFLSNTICKTQVNVNRRWLGANWSSDKNYTFETKLALKEFAQRINVAFNTDDYIVDSDYTASNLNDDFGYQDPKQIVKDVGYFRGEIYPFAIKGVLEGGFETEAFPIKSYDGHYTGNNPLSNSLLEKGLVRFPFWDREVIDIFLNNVSRRKIMKVVFNMTAAQLYLNDPANNYKFNKIIGFKFVRGERNDNLITQGALFNVSNGHNAFGSIRYYDGENGADSSDSCFIPIFDTGCPAGVYNRINGNWAYEPSVANISNTKRALFSPESLLKKSFFNNDNYYAYSFLKLTDYNIQSDNAYRAPGDYSVISKHNSSEFFGGISMELVEASFIDQDVYKGQNGFTSHMEDGKVGSLKGFNFLASTQKDYWNRSYFTPSFIGLKKSSDFYDPIAGKEIHITNLYKNDNNSDYFLSVATNFNVETEKYSEIGDYIPKTDLSNTSIVKVIGGGDCFLNRFSFRQRRHLGKDDNSNDYDSMGIYYGHGLLVSIILESSVNPYLRGNTQFLDNSSNEKEYTFYPKVVSRDNGYYSWLVGDEDENLFESFYLNDGYSQLRSIKEVLGYNSKLLAVQQKFKDRIYFSGKDISGSYIDNWRVIGSNDYIDVHNVDGEIIKLEEYYGRIVCITSNRILELYVDERVLNTEDGETILGIEKTVLSETVRILADFGSQHINGVKKTDSGIYGLDVNKEICWVVRLTSGKLESETKTTSPQLQAFDLGQETKNEYEIKKMFSNRKIDKSNPLDDNPLNGEGVTIGYDKYLNEVYFSVFLNTGNLDHNVTICYNELLRAFKGTLSLYGTKYFNLDKKTFSVGLIPSNDLYEHNQGDYMKFHGIQGEFKLSFIVNGTGGKGSNALLKKVFSSLLIEMNEVTLNKILYETDTQDGEYNFQTIDEAFKPEYLDNEWNVPVSLQITSENQVELTDSDLKGKFLKITIVYSPESSAEEILIKNVITSFNQLFN